MLEDLTSLIHVLCNVHFTEEKYTKLEKTLIGVTSTVVFILVVAIVTAIVVVVILSYKLKLERRHNHKSRQY